MNSTTNRLTEINNYFANGDTHVGYRRLLDAAIETQDMSVYEKTLAFCDWYDGLNAGGNADASVLNEKVASLLEVIGRAQHVDLGRKYESVLRAENLGKTFSHGSFSLSSVDIHLHPAQIIGLVGENGNGKTTLLRLLYGELKQDTGTIQYHLHNVPNPSSFYDIKTRLAFIPQRSNPWYGSLMDNLLFTSAHYGFKGKENHLWTEMICARMGLRAFRTFTWGRISSGYKMRFELAKALIKKPEVLLLDEPLANLDVLAQQVILEDLRFLAHSKQMPLGIILSSQQLYEVEKVSEQVIFLKQGKPRYQQTNTKIENQLPTQLIMELETTASREALKEVFETLAVQNISFNGGVYLLYFGSEISSSDVIRVLGEAKLPVKYFRDISASSRRFFDA
ncbi:MAG: ABC transporter ATP-binding protein [Chitinophagaceae bacterium]|nr:ABC transporter ATP-binding protein [Chitinophagaceae bacterium]